MSGPPRRPYVAGMFYPDDPRRLRGLVDELAREARTKSRRAAAEGIERPDPSIVAGLLVPHAGLVYSGAIAALSWLLAAEVEPDTIVIAGTDHQGWATGIGVWCGGPWTSPIGDVPVNDELASAIAALGEAFSRDDRSHDGEHSIEVQLPLIARLCPEARIVPMAVSPRLRSHARAGEMLGHLLSERRAAGERILLTASSDMAHYPRAQICESTDAELLQPLLRLDPDTLFELEGNVLGEGRPGLVCGLCGIDPVRVTLSALREMGASRGVLLGSATSADAGGDPGRTVGYAAVAFV
jgi:AmmeMemoRadiSam system protein B